MASPTTDRYPFQLVTAVPLDTALELYSLAYAHGLSKAAMVRAVIESGLAALSPSYEEITNATRSEADHG